MSDSLHRIKVLGRELKVRNSASPERVRQIESFINRKVEEVQKSTTVTDPQIIAVLALLNIVETFMEVSEINDADSRRFGYRLSNLTQRVEEVLL